MTAPTKEEIGAVVLAALQNEADRLVPHDSDRESLEQMDAEAAVAMHFDAGWARDTLADLLERMVELYREETLRERIADDSCDDCGEELVEGAHLTRDPADDRMVCPCCGQEKEAA